METLPNYTHGFERGYELLASRDLLEARNDLLEARNDLLEALGATDYVSFTLYKSGARTMAPEQAKRVENVFANYGILAPWGSYERRY